jgi:hypothetical protein
MIEGESNTVAGEREEGSLLIGLVPRVWKFSCIENLFLIVEANRGRQGHWLPCMFF